MINLIPPNQKQNIFLEKIKKMVIVFWFLIFFFVVCLSLVLFSINIYVKSQLESDQAYAVQFKKEFSQEKVDEFRQKVKLINSQIEKVDQFYKENIYFSDALGDISSILPAEIYLKEFSLILDSKNNIKVSLQGFSPDRESLFNFREVLDEKKEFIGVSFPSSNWIEKNNINFSVNFEINNE